MDSIIYHFRAVSMINLLIDAINKKIPANRSPSLTS
jgi:hypothetical protein